ncbi:MAG TPA: pectinesterase family protein [Tepidisphaeraceae bacterium]|nr:pectinesterase family protein [Tepidisphaeraceae bacterium]
MNNSTCDTGFQPVRNSSAHSDTGVSPVPSTSHGRDGHVTVTMALLIMILCFIHAANAKTITVAADGSGDFKTVQAAVDSITGSGPEHTVIHIRPGTYKERILLAKGKPPITFQGDDATTTILTNDWNSHHVENGREVGTSGSYSTMINSDDFTAENVTFENTAGDTGQAVALMTNGDKHIFRNCRMLGWQDTLYANGYRQYYDHCYIAGRVDFIFGNSTAIFDHCEIHSRNGGHVTAASTAQTRPWGYVFLDCKLTGEGAQADLGRPWRPYASVAFVRCEIGEHIKPAGWSVWNGNENHKTARYYEYKNTGPGADRSKRLDWTHELTEEQAKDLTVEKLLSGEDHWDPRASKKD